MDDNNKTTAGQTLHNVGHAIKDDAKATGHDVAHGVEKVVDGAKKTGEWVADKAEHGVEKVDRAVTGN